MVQTPLYKLWQRGSNLKINYLWIYQGTEFDLFIWMNPQVIPLDWTTTSYISRFSRYSRTQKPWFKVGAVLLVSQVKGYQQPAFELDLSVTANQSITQTILNTFTLQLSDRAQLHSLVQADACWVFSKRSSAAGSIPEFHQSSVHRLRSNLSYLCYSNRTRIAP